MRTKELNREEAIEFGILQPIEGRDDEYLFNGKPWKVHPNDKIEIRILEDEIGPEDIYVD